MLTLLPYADFNKVCLVLTDKDLTDCRYIGLQCFKTLIPRAMFDLPNLTPNDPNLRMWKMYEETLCEYCMAMCCEHWSRGLSSGHTYGELCLLKKYQLGTLSFRTPHWLNDNYLIESHQSYLLALNPRHYKWYFNVPNNLPLIWPEEITCLTLSK